MVEEMAPEERERAEVVYEACAERDAWSLAEKLIGPLVEMAHLVGNEEFVYLMEKALIEAQETAAEKRAEYERVAASL